VVVEKRLVLKDELHHPAPARGARPEAEWRVKSASVERLEPHEKNRK
jgi:hypothetical protein